MSGWVKPRAYWNIVVLFHSKIVCLSVCVCVREREREREREKERERERK